MIGLRWWKKLDGRFHYRPYTWAGWGARARYNAYKYKYMYVISRLVRPEDPMTMTSLRKTTLKLAPVIKEKERLLRIQLELVFEHFDATSTVATPCSPFTPFGNLIFRGGDLGTILLPSMEQPDPNEMEERPTVSHQLAETNDDCPEHGAAQTKHNTAEVEDLGWHADPHQLPEPLIGELTNEQLWTLTRRFNKQLFHVKALDEPPVSSSSIPKC